MTRRLLGGDRGPCGPCTSRKDVLRVGCRWSLALLALFMPPIKCPKEAP